MELREEQARSEAAGESDDGVDEAAGEETA